MQFTMNLKGQVNQLRLPKSKALWPLFETIVNAIQSLEDVDNYEERRIVVTANRLEPRQINIDGSEEVNHFNEFIVSDNGDGFNEKNYKSFLEAYSTLKIAKGCKGIGRFLWLKAFDKVEIKSTYSENGRWYRRQFEFSIDGISPMENLEEITEKDFQVKETIIKLIGFHSFYANEVTLSLENLAKKIIEHCLLYFIANDCPQITLFDNLGENINLNTYFCNLYQDCLHQDRIIIEQKEFTLYHMTMTEGAERHELHLCANSREVKTYDLSKYLPNLERKIISDGRSFYYVGYMVGTYLDEAVTSERYEFDFVDLPVLGGITEKNLTSAAVEYISAYLENDLAKIKDEKKKRIDEFICYKKPQYRYLINQRQEVYDAIPVGLSDEKLDLELYKHEQKWEYDIAKQKAEIEQKNDSIDNWDQYMELFNEYCSNVTKLSQASLAEYVVRRKAVIELLEKALEVSDDGNYNREAQIHSIICPMRVTSDKVKFDDMNLWLIDDRMAYHQFLASDVPMKSLPIMDNDSINRMDIALFDRAISYSSDIDTINSITIVELKKPQRDDLTKDDNNPINQVLGYVSNIKNGKVKKANGRDFGNVSNASFYCYVIADLTNSLKIDAENAGLIKTPDGEGYFGYNQPRGAYIEVISYDKLVRDARKRNQVLFDKLFHPKASNLVNLVCEED